MKISRIATACLAVALLAFLATDVMAQPGGGRPGGGRPGGGRGPGGPGGFGGPQSLGQMALGLLRVEEVKKEIDLMPDQEEALTKMAGERPERPQFDFQNASEAERDEFIAKMRKEREERTAKMQEQLEEILLPDQYDRLKEVAIQMLDVGALMMDEVAEELKITDAQKKEFEEKQNIIREKMGAQMRELFQGGGGDRDAMREKMAKMREDNNKELLSVLTATQKSDFEKMKGEKFEMPEGGMRAMFGGGRGGPGGGGPGGRGGFGGRRGGGDGGGQPRRPASEE